MSTAAKHITWYVGVILACQVEPETGSIGSTRTLRRSRCIFHPSFRQDLLTQPVTLIEVEQTKPGIVPHGSIDIGRLYKGTGWIRFKEDRKSTRLNSSHVKISYAVFCLKKK